MRRVFVALLCVTLALVSTSEVNAQRNKKGKELELAVCKRGKLIFEDDFSGKELEWTVVDGEWKIEKKALVTKSKGTPRENALRISRPFLAVPNVIFEFRTILPAKGMMNMGTRGDVSPVYPRAFLKPQARALSIGYWDDTQNFDLAMRPLVYEKPRWLGVVFELIGGQYALTVDNKTIRGDVPSTEGVQRNTFYLYLWNPDGEMFALDDVKVYEALPKDEAENKDEKGKKKK